MELERYFESCGACGSRTIHFVIDPPNVRYHCANCGRDNSTTWGSRRLPDHNGPAFDRVLDRMARFDVGPAAKYEPRTPPLIKTWDSLSAFEKSSHFSDAALHQ
jgi:hypothetical protein